MAINPIVEQNLIMAKIDAEFTQPVYENDQVKITYTNGVLDEYLSVDFGSPVATIAERSIAAEDKQPYVSRVIVAYVAGTKLAARTGASAVAGKLTGFTPNSNSGPLKLVGGGSYTLADSAAKPIQYVSETFFTFMANLAPTV